MAKAQRALLPPNEIERLNLIVKNGSTEAKQRAQTILCWQDGLSAVETGKRTKLNEAQVYKLWRSYKQKGLDLFLAEATTSKSKATAVKAPITVEADVPLTVEALAAEHGSDMQTSQHVTAFAMQIFDAMSNIHRLSSPSRSLLEVAASLHNLAGENVAAKSRDLILEKPIYGLNDEERQLVAAVVACSGKRLPKPESDAAFKLLPVALHNEVFALAAILRVAVGLGASKARSTIITGIDESAEQLLILLDGDQAANDAQTAQKMTDLWIKTYPLPVNFTLRMPHEIALPEQILPGPSARAAQQLTVTGAGRHAALRSLTRIETLLKFLNDGDLSTLPTLARESARLRELALLADARDFKRELSWLHESIEQARIESTFIERLSAIVEDAAGLRQVAEPALAEHREALVAAIKALELRKFDKFAETFRLALNDEVDPNEKALLRFNVGEILWGQLTTLRTVMEFGDSVPDALNATRSLQDHLTAFRDLLGGELSQVLDVLLPLESYLANIHLTQRILTLLEPQPIKKGRKVVTPELDAASDLLRAGQADLINMLADGLPTAWNAVNSPLFRRAFALAIASA